MKTLFFIILVSALSLNCQKDISSENGNTPTTSLASLTTLGVTSITNITAASGGNISNDGGATVTARGVCWSTSPNPIVTGNHTTNGTGIGTFVSNITGLTSSTIYYVRAYATNIDGTAYGNEISFTTTNTSTALATLTTSPVTSITSTTASSGGNISNDGGATVTARGVCWGTLPNPTVIGNHTTNGTGTGIFNSNITGLTAGTTYYIRAYATNSVGTAYGNELNFTSTSSSTPNVYVVGWEVEPLNSVGKLWKNGTAISLTNGIYSAYINSVYISGLDEYVGGYEYLDNGPNYRYVAKIWKNGVGNPLSNSINNSSVNSVFVSGSDVYAGGFEEFKATIWKNGVPTILSNALNSVVKSIFVSGTDVYAAGVENNQAIVWKNGLPTSYTSGPNGNSANSVFVSGSNVYVVGIDFPYVVSWVNSVPSILLTGTPPYASANSIFVSGSDVYVAGFEGNGTHHVAKIWKNGIVTSLTDGTNEAIANSVYVLGGDVYVAGYENSGITAVAKVWKNGTPSSLPATYPAYSTGIFVK